MLHIRKAFLSDIPLIRQLADEIFRYTYRVILTPEQIDYMMEWMYSVDSLEKQMNEGHQFFIPEEESVPIGYMSVQHEDEHIFHLQKLYLLSSLQGKGYGKSLLQYAMKYIHSVHPQSCYMRLNVNRYNTKAVDFYTRMGMKKVYEGDFHIGNGFYMNDYIMEIEVR